MINLLFVDDEADLDLIYKWEFDKWVKEEKCSYTFKNSAVDALEYVRKTNVEDLLILTDITMDEMDGLELLTIVKNEFPKIKVIILSGNLPGVYKEKSLSLGADAYYEKPVDFEEIKMYLMEEFDIK